MDQPATGMPRETAPETTIARPIPSADNVAADSEGGTYISRMNSAALLHCEPQFKASLDAEALLKYTHDGINRIRYILLNNNTDAAARLHRRLAPTLDRLNDCSQIIDVIAQAVPCMIHVWAFVKVLLLVILSLVLPTYHGFVDYSMRIGVFKLRRRPPRLGPCPGND